jgi:hypothetical protein
MARLGEFGGCIEGMVHAAQAASERLGVNLHLTRRRVRAREMAAADQIVEPGNER